MYTGLWVQFRQNMPILYISEQNRQSREGTRRADAGVPFFL